MRKPRHEEAEMKRLGVRRLLAALVVTAASACLGSAQGLAADHRAGARLHVEASFTATVVEVSACAIDVTASGTALGTHVGIALWTDSETLDPCSQAPNVHVV